VKPYCHLPTPYPINPLDSRGDTVNSPLYVVTCITNPVRYWARYELYYEFARRVADAGAILYTVEAAYGNRQHAITDQANPNHIQLRMQDEVWHKENLLNLAIQRLPADWKYVAWIDADVLFSRPDWVAETIQQLQTYQVVQLFTEALDLGPNYELIKRHKGYVYCELNGMRESPGAYGSEGSRGGVIAGAVPPHFHSGFAWAARREAIDALGGLIDFSILGAADKQMAAGFFGCMEYVVPKDISAGYREQLLLWQDRAERYVKRNVGYVEGLLLHHWHGSKVNRQYFTRWQILTETGFDPELDLKRDWQGMYQLTERSSMLRDRIRGYFRQRNEDSIDAS
jgi:hypothetical protein